MTAPLRWPCRYYGCTRLSSFVAIDDRAPRGHICQQCWRALFDKERALYAKIEDR